MTNFAEFLVSQVPFYDERILTNMMHENSKPYLHALPIDVRLLPNKLRAVYVEGEFSSCKRIRVRFKMQRWKFKLLRKQACDLLLQRLEAWLNSLPKRKRNREFKKRWFADSWIGNVTVGDFRETAKERLDRFKNVFPNTNERWNAA